MKEGKGGREGKERGGERKRKQRTLREWVTDEKWKLSKVLDYKSKISFWVTGVQIGQKHPWITFIVSISKKHSLGAVI